MTLPASGAISLFDVNDELGLSHTAQIGLLCTNVRTLFGTASGAVGMTTGYGKSNTSVPGTPTSVSASATSYSSASVSFSAPACTGHLTIDYYQAISSPGCITATGTSPISVTGLSESSSYTFRVRAHNSKGYGCYSSASGSITTPANGYNMYAWGAAGCGGLGGSLNGSCLSGLAKCYRIYTSPRQVNGGGWTKVCVQCAALAQKGNGSLWTWGRNASWSGVIGNNDGQLGVGFTAKTSASSPIQVGSLTNWSSNFTRGGSGYVSLAIKNDGTLWGWGINRACGGGLLDGNPCTTQNTIQSPIQIGSSTWSKIAISAASIAGIKTDGTIWAWGQATSQLTGGSTCWRSASNPRQITTGGGGCGGTWTNIIASGYYSYYAQRCDGTLWAWGNNSNGQLGYSTHSQWGSLRQIGALTNWRMDNVPHQGAQFAVFTKTDGTMWGWGRNDCNQLGIGHTYAYNSNGNSPIQLGSSSDWDSVSLGSFVGMALKTNGTLWGWGNSNYGFMACGGPVCSPSPYSIPTQVNSCIFRSKSLSYGYGNNIGAALKC